MSNIVQKIDLVRFDQDGLELDVPELTEFSPLRTTPFSTPDGVTAGGELKSMLMLCVADNIELFRRTLIEASNIKGIARLEISETDDRGMECAVSVCQIIKGSAQHLTGTDAFIETQSVYFASSAKVSSLVREAVSESSASAVIDRLKSFDWMDNGFTHADKVKLDQARANLVDRVEQGTLYPIIVNTLFWQDGNPLGSTEIFSVRLPELPIRTPVKARRKSPDAKSEAELEKDLRNWLLGNGFGVEQQVTSGDFRYDLWIPGEFFMEIKKSKINSNDICQVISYLSKTDLSFILIGQSIGGYQSQAIESINRLLGKPRILFIQWSCAKEVLSAMLAKGRGL